MKGTIRSAVVIVALAGVAGSTPTVAAQTKGTSPAAVAASEACTLLTREAAAAALGEAVQGPPKGTSMEGVSSCDYSGASVHSIVLNVFHLPPDQAAVYKAMCAKKGHEGLTGLGETSCWYNAKHAELQVLKGTLFFSIELRRGGDSTEAIKAAAKSVFDRIK